MLQSLVLYSLLGSALQQVSGAAISDTPYQAQLHGEGHPDAVPDSYLVAFKQNYTIAQHWQTIGTDLSNATGFVHFDAFWGYAATLDADTLNLVRGDQNVDFVETEQLLNKRPMPPSSPSSNNSAASAKAKRDYQSITDTSAPFNLQMIGAGAKLTTPVYDGGEYEYINGAGRGVNIYILDSGVRVSHSLFGGRAKNFGGLKSTDNTPYCYNEQMRDLDGHGTHVAGIAGAQHFGVAPGANIINVKVICDQGSSIKYIIKALNDVSNEHNANRKNKKGWDFRGSVINMSFGGYGGQYWLGQAVGWARWYGINFAGAAGNDNKDTSDDWPCYWSSVMCVGAVDRTYAKASYSNHGSQIDFLAPGTDVVSLSYLNDYGTAKMSGCSMASPHVAGMAAIFVSWKGLATGGADGYVYSNSLSGLSSGWPWFWTPATKNYFATSGIRNPRKYPKEPFRWASDNPAANAVNVGVVPIALAADTVIPAFANQTDVVTIATGVSTSTISTIPSFEPASFVGLDTKYDNMTFPNATVTSSIPESTVPPSVLSGLGITALGGWNATLSASQSLPTSAAACQGNQTEGSCTQASPTPATACQGNQIEGSCTQAHLPSSTPDSGPESPVCYKDDSSGDYLMFNATQTADGVSQYCASLISSKVILSASETEPNPSYIAGAAENGGYVAITVVFDVDSCDPNTSSASQKLDFGTWTLDNCYLFLYTSLADVCAKDSTWPDYNPQYSLEGGVYGANCALWSMAGLPGSPPTGGT